MVNALPPGGPRALTRYSDDELRIPTLRDVVSPLFRYRRAVSLTFVGLILAIFAAAGLAERTYEAEMKILVKRERVDPVLTGDAQARGSADGPVTDSELFAEVELLKSRDLLEQVAAAAGLVRTARVSGAAQNDPQAQVARAGQSLRAHLDVEPIKRTPIIRIAYTAADPRTAARVLDELARLYLEKHLAVHRPTGAYQFFSDQTAHFERELRTAEANLKAFTERERVVSASHETESTLRQLSEFEGALQKTHADIADSTRRMQAIGETLASTPDRQVTQISTSGNVEAVRNLRAQILDLEVKQAEMLRKFTPQYPPAVQLAEQLALLREALTATERMPLQGLTTDQNPTHQWLRNEAARVQTEKDALTARAGALRRTIAAYSERAQRLDAQGIEQQELLRAVKESEDNYTLYRRKQEEARISDALDRTRIANVSVAEPPAIPRSSESSRSLILFGGGFGAIVLSLASAYLLNAFDPRFRTPDDVYRVLDVPVLAALPPSSE